MARVNILKVTKETNKKDESLVKLENYVKELSEKKPTFDNLKKRVDVLKKDIKDLFNKLNLSEYDYENFNVSVTKIEKQSFDYDRMLEWAIANDLPIVKTIQIIDDELLENATYNGIIAPVDLKQFQITKIEERMNTKILSEQEVN